MKVRKFDDIINGDKRRPLQVQSVSRMTNIFSQIHSQIQSVEDKTILITNLNGFSINWNDMKQQLLTSVYLSLFAKERKENCKLKI